MPRIPYEDVEREFDRIGADSGFEQALKIMLASDSPVPPGGPPAAV